jgi:murein L,D-transpeptidase YcbB/YkuD
MNLFNRLLFIFSFLLLTQSACEEQKAQSPAAISAQIAQSPFSTDGFSEALQVLLPPIDTINDRSVHAAITPRAKLLTLVYQKNEYLPIWFDENEVATMAQNLLHELDSLQFEGLDTSRYQLALLQSLYQKISAKQGHLSDVISFDTLMTHMYILAAHDLLFGQSRISQVDSHWHHTNDTLWQPLMSIAGMGISKQYQSLLSYKSQWPLYAMMREASIHYHSLQKDSAFVLLQHKINSTAKDSLVLALIHQEMPWLQSQENDSLTELQQMLRGYQYYFGQRLTGKLDSATVHCMQLTPAALLQQIAVNQDRLRWMNQVPEPMHIIVPLALMELFLNKDGVDVMHMRTVVGKPARPTPSLNATMVNVVLNPSWGVPPTILKKDIAPGLTQKGGAYLAKKDLKAYDRKGNVVSASTVNAHNYKKFVYKQAPGERNALGAIKFNLPNPFDIYLHDTPHKEDFPNRNRAKSSGCIRLQYPRELGVYILNILEANPKMNRAAVDSIVLTHKTQYYPLKNRIPVHIVYLTVFKDSVGAQIRFLEDVYNRDIVVAKQF